MRYIIMLIISFMFFSCGGGSGGGSDTYYQVTFNADGGQFATGSTTVTTSEIAGKIFDLATYPRPVKSGYFFLHWIDDANNIHNSNYKVTSNVTFKAIWSDQPTVTLSANGGSFSSSDEVKVLLNIGDMFNPNSQPSPTRNGCNFLGWFTAASGGIQINSPQQITDNTVYYAQWKGYSLSKNNVNFSDMKINSQNATVSMTDTIDITHINGGTVLSAVSSHAALGAFLSGNKITVTANALPTGNYTITVTGTINQTIFVTMTDGSASYPYQISNATELDYIRYNLNDNKVFELSNDINLSGIWEPLGYDRSNHSSPTPFKGKLNGNNYTIRGLQLPGTTTYYNGLFAMIENGSTVEKLNIHIINDSDSFAGLACIGNPEIGALAGETGGGNSETTIRNVTVSGQLHSQWYPGGYCNMGGILGNGIKVNIIDSSSSVEINTQSRGRAGSLAGRITGTVTSSYATGNVSSMGNHVGGLIGEIGSATLTNTYATGNVKGQNIVGGLIGYGSSSTIEASYATGNVTGNNDTTVYRNAVGGLIGDSGSITVSNCYALGNVSGITEKSIFLGGLVGQLGGTVTNSYAVGSVSGTRQVGGLAGAINSSGAEIRNSVAMGSHLNFNEDGYRIAQKVDGNLVANYARADMQNKSGIILPNSGDENGIDILPMSMQTESFWKTTLSWDFTNTWKWDDINNRPILKWQP